MSNLNNLTSKILQDAEAKKAVILSDAENEKIKFLARSNKKLAQLKKLC